MKLPDLHPILDEAFEIFRDKSEFVVAVPRRRQHSDGLEERQPTKREDATPATRRHLVLAKFVSFDAGQHTSSELVPIINGTLAT